VVCPVLSSHYVTNDEQSSGIWREFSDSLNLFSFVEPSNYANFVDAIKQTLSTLILSCLIDDFCQI
jgi:hypothetical protein